MKKIFTIIIVIVALQLGVVSIASASGGSYHKVYKGETLYSIGRQYNVSPYAIADVNGLYNPDHIYYGQVLYIPEGNYGYGHDGYGHDGYGHDGYGHDGYGNNYHEVMYGETLHSIGRMYDANPYDIAEENGIYNPNYIYYGQLLHIPEDSHYPSGYGHGYNQYDYDHGRNDYDNDRGYNRDDRGYGRDHGSKYDSGRNYGYDYTGYYYDNHGKRYSYTCGYYYNCW